MEINLGCLILGHIAESYSIHRNYPGFGATCKGCKCKLVMWLSEDGSHELSSWEVDTR